MTKKFKIPSDLSAAIEKHENSRNLAKMRGIRERIVHKRVHEK